MINKIIYFIACISVLINIYLVYKLYNKEPTKIIYNSKLDSLKVEKQTIIDSIVKLDTIIEIIDKTHEKEINYILNQPVDSDCLFFAEYLRLSKNLK